MARQRPDTLSVKDKPGYGSAQTIAYGIFMFIGGIAMALTGNIVLEGIGGLLILVGLPLMIIGTIAWNRVQKKQKLQARMGLQNLNPYPQNLNPYPQTVAQPIYIQAQPVSTHTEVTRETVVKVRCKNCASLNYETANRCTNCGATL